jgi:hypothetical protein
MEMTRSSETAFDQLLGVARQHRSVAGHLAVEALRDDGAAEVEDLRVDHRFGERQPDRGARAEGLCLTEDGVEEVERHVARIVADQVGPEHRGVIAQTDVAHPTLQIAEVVDAQHQPLRR